mgnify:CR=1 FL=1
MQYVFSALYGVAARKAIKLDDFTFGIVGVGHVGSLVEKMARYLGFKVLLCDPPRAAAEGPDAFCSLDYLLANSQIVTMHVPLDETTRNMADKHFFGWFDGEKLVAMMDLIWRHPKPDMAFIGWFILDASVQGSGLGRRLVSEVLAMLKKQGVNEVRLGRIEGNPQSEHFWHVCGFEENGLGYDTDDYHVIVMAKKL